MAELEDTHWWFAARRAILLKLIRGLDLRPDARILEVGCGTGGNLAMLAQVGRTYAMESEPAAIGFASKRGLAEIRQGRLPEDIPFAGIDFDLVLMTDVLEHLEQEETCLRAVRARLRPGGWLLMTVPALPWLWSRHDETHHHLRRYLMGGLRELLTRAGYDVRYVSYFNSILFPLIAATRISRRLFGATAEGHDLAMPPTPLNRLLTAVFGAECYLIGRVVLPAGVSLVLLAQKPAA